MPFISKDWRSPGEEWVKTEEGWENKKILECGRQILWSHSESTDPRCASLSSCDQGDRDSNFPRVPNAQWIDENEDEDDDSNKENLQEGQKRSVQPHCRITIRCTKEIAGFNRLSDAFKRLDFRNAVHDVRRFNYICKLLDILISQNLTMLPGCAQKVLFKMLEEVAHHVSVSQQNIHTLNRLLGQLRIMIDCACWGQPLGSTLLWESHLRTIDRILTIASGIRISEPGNEVYPKMEDLPEECVREILLRLNDHKDLESARRAYSVMAKLVDEQRIWKELCQFHFTREQIDWVFGRMDIEIRKNWQHVYHKLRKYSLTFPSYRNKQHFLLKPFSRQVLTISWMINVDRCLGGCCRLQWNGSKLSFPKSPFFSGRRFGLREEYAEMIQLCRKCRCLFWKSFGHPCIVDEIPGLMEKLKDVDESSLHIPIPPQAFLKFFSL